MNQPKLTKDALNRFDLSGIPLSLPGGSNETFKVGDFVLKHIHDTSLENDHSLKLIQWLAEISHGIKEDGFRIPRPLKTKLGTWIDKEGWTAWSFLEGT